MHKGLFAVVALTCAGACGPVGSGTRTSTAAPSPHATVTEGANQGPGVPSASPIVAQLIVTKEEVARDADVEVTVHIENRGTDPIVLMAEELSAPSVLFDVRDATGQHLPPTSPPIPSGSKHAVQPGKNIDIKMTLAGMFSPPLKPGAYSVRLRRIDSPARRFVIAVPSRQ